MNFGKLANYCASIFLIGILIAIPILFVLGIISSLILNFALNEFITITVSFVVRILAFLVVVVPLFAGICGFFLFVYHACKRDMRGNLKIQLTAVFILLLLGGIWLLIQIDNPLKPNRDYFIRSSEAILESLNATPASNTSNAIGDLIQKYNTANNEVGVTRIEVENTHSLYAYSHKTGLGEPRVHFVRDEQDDSSSWKCEVRSHGTIEKGYFYLWCIPPDDPNKQGAGEW